MIDVSHTTIVGLQFATEDDIVSAAIRWFSSGDYSHVDFILPDSMLLGARSGDVKDGGGVQIRQAGYAPFTRTKILAVPTPKAPAIYRAALSQRYSPYDYLACAAIAAPWLTPTRDWENPGQWFCSELVLWAFKRGGFFDDVRVVLPARRATPVDDLDILQPFAA